MRKAPNISLSAEARETLTKWFRGRSTLARVVQRAKIILMAAEGIQNNDIAAALGTTRRCVGTWRTRYASSGIDGIIKDAPRSGRKPTKRDSIANENIVATTQSRPANATHWSTRLMAAHLNTTQSMVRRVWKANNLKPHLVKTFKVSNDKGFIEKALDVIGW